MYLSLLSYWPWVPDGTVKCPFRGNHFSSMGSCLCERALFLIDVNHGTLLIAEIRSLLSMNKRLRSVTP